MLAAVFDNPVAGARAAFEDACASHGVWWSSMSIGESKTHPVSCAVIIGVCPRLHELCTSKIALMSCFSASKQGHALQSKPRNHETWQWRTARRSIPCIAAMTSFSPIAISTTVNHTNMNTHKIMVLKLLFNSVMQARIMVKMVWWGACRSMRVKRIRWAVQSL